MDSNNSLVNDLKLMNLGNTLKKLVASEREKAEEFKTEFEAIYTEYCDLLDLSGKELGTDVDENGDEYIAVASVFYVPPNGTSSERPPYFYDNVFMKESKGGGHYMGLMDVLDTLDKLADEIMDSAYDISIKKAELAKILVADSMGESQWSLGGVTLMPMTTEIDKLLVAESLLKFGMVSDEVFKLDGTIKLDETGAEYSIKNFASNIIETAGFSYEEKKEIEQALKDYHYRKENPNDAAEDETSVDEEQQVVEDGSEHSETGETKKGSVVKEQDSEENDSYDSEESADSESSGEEATEGDSGAEEDSDNDDNDESEESEEDDSNDEEESDDDSEEEKEDSDEEESDDDSEEEKEDSNEEESDDDSEEEKEDSNEEESDDDSEEEKEDSNEEESDDDSEEEKEDSNEEESEEDENTENSSNKESSSEEEAKEPESNGEKPAEEKSSEEEVEESSDDSSEETTGGEPEKTESQESGGEETPTATVVEQEDDDESTASTDTGGEKADTDSAKPEEKQPSQTSGGDKYTSDDDDDDYETGTISISDGEEKHGGYPSSISGGYYDDSSNSTYSDRDSYAGTTGAKKAVSSTLDIGAAKNNEVTSSYTKAITGPQGDVDTPSVLETTSGKDTSTISGAVSTTTGSSAVATTAGNTSATGAEIVPAAGTTVGSTTDTGTQVISGSSETAVSSSPSETVVTSSPSETVVTSSPSETAVTAYDDSYYYGGEPSGYSEYESIPDTGVDIKAENKRGNMFIPTVSGALLGAGLGMVAKNMADKEKEEDEDEGNN